MSIIVKVLVWFFKALGFGFGVGKAAVKVTIKEARGTIPQVTKALKEGAKSGQNLDIKNTISDWVKSLDDGEQS